MKNYYVILGVESDATIRQIRDAYRRLAKELHPDYYGRDSGPFIDLQEAYAVLSDPTRRRVYDKSHQDPLVENRQRPRRPSEPLYSTKSTPEPLIPRHRPADLGDYSLTGSFRTFGPSLEEIFDRLWRNFSLVRPEAEQLRSLNVKITISPEEAIHGGWARILVPARLVCPDCLGKGGTGYYECWRCAGYGYIQGEYPMTISFPAGVVNNYVIEVPLDRFGITNFYLRVIFRISEGL